MSVERACNSLVRSPTPIECHSVQSWRGLCTVISPWVQQPSLFRFEVRPVKCRCSVRWYHVPCKWQLEVTASISDLEADFVEREAEDYDSDVATTLEEKLLLSIAEQAQRLAIPRTPSIVTVIAALGVVRSMLAPGDASAEHAPSGHGFDGAVLYRVVR